MRSASSYGIINLFLLGLAAPVLGQPAATAAEEAEVAVLALARVIEEFPALTGDQPLRPDDAAIHPEAIPASDETREGGGQPHARSLLERVEGNLGMSVRPLDSILVCRDEEPVSCVLRGARAAFLLGTPSLTGDSGVVRVDVVYMLPRYEDQPVNRTAYEVALSNGSDGWQVEELRVIGTS